jgi:predicted glycosyltransferase
MKVWIDITNSPHVLFFEPIVRDLRAAGHEVEITARDYAQTVPLLAEKNMAHTLIGRHRGKSLVKKALGFASRSFRLAWWAARRRFDVAFSHNSNDLALAARMIGVPHLIVYDYEHATLSHSVNGRLVQRIMVPEAIPTEAIVRNGAKARKVGHFPGLKEHVYMTPDDPSEDMRPRLGAGPDDVLVVVRPPATMSAYHRFENDLFREVLDRLIDFPGSRIVLLPRTQEQRQEMLAFEFPGNVLVPEGVLPAISLLNSADLVLSAGGTMNREAAVLGVPAYTVFAGRMGAVDKYLIEQGRLVEVKAPEDVVMRRRDEGEGWWVENRSLVLEELESLSKRR